jgi:leader peptidase (prepilin peptidase) / N-methyltransferase
MVKIDMEGLLIVYYVLTGILLFFIGASLASFLGLINYRFNRDVNLESVIAGDSLCDGCSRKLTWFEKIPVFGWMLTFGKCPSCNYKVSIFYPLSEALLGVLFVLLFFTNQPFYYYPLLSFLFLFTLSDLEFMEIPKDFIHYGLIFAFIVFVYQLIVAGTIAAVIIGLILTIVFLILNKIKYSFGFGDILIFLMMSMILDVGDYLLFLFVTFLTGALVSLMLVAFDKSILKKYIPFVPFILLGFIFTLFVIL